MEGRPGALLHVRLLLPHPEPEGDPERREADGGAEGALRVQVLNLDKTTSDAPIVSYLTRALTVSVHFVLQPVKTSQDQLIVSALTFCFCRIAKISLKSVKIFYPHFTLHTLFLYRTSLNVYTLIRFLLSEVKPCLCV